MNYNSIKIWILLKISLMHFLKNTRKDILQSGYIFDRLNAYYFKTVGGVYNRHCTDELNYLFYFSDDKSLHA